MGKVKSVTLKEAFAPISQAIKEGRSAEEMLSTLDQLKQSMCAKEVTVVQSDESFEERAASLAENMGLKEYTLEYSDGKAVEVKRCDSLWNAFTYAIPHVVNKEADYLTALTDKARELMDVASMGFGSEEHVRDLTCHVAQYAKDLCADLGPSEDNTIGDIPDLDCVASKVFSEEEKAAAFTVSGEPFIISKDGTMTIVDKGNTPTAWTPVDMDKPAPHEVTNPELPTNAQLSEDLPECTGDVCTCSSHIYTDAPSKYAYVADIHKGYMDEQHLTVLEIQAVIKEVEEAYEIMDNKWNEALSVLSVKSNAINEAEENGDNYLIHVAYLEYNEAIEEESYLQDEVNALLIKLNGLKAHEAIEKHKEQLSKVTYEGLMIAHDYKTNS